MRDEKAEIEIRNMEEITANSNNSIKFSPPDISDLEIEYVSEALQSGWITTGYRTKKLEHMIEGWIGFSRAVC